MSAEDQLQIRAVCSRAIGLGIVLGLISFGVSSAKVAPVKLSEVITKSELIVVGKVGSVASDSSAQQSAILEVEEAWRGAPGSTVRVSLEPTWPCDISRAIVAERGIFFLSRHADAQWHISHSGHGRMEIVGDQVAVSPMVLLPDEVGPSVTEVRKVPLQIMAFYVRAQVEKLGH